MRKRRRARRSKVRYCVARARLNTTPRSRSTTHYKNVACFATKKAARARLWKELDREERRYEKSRGKRGRTPWEYERLDTAFPYDWKVIKRVPRKRGFITIDQFAGLRGRKRRRRRRR